MYPLSRVCVLKVFPGPPVSRELVRAVPSSSSSLFFFLCERDLSPVPTKQKEMAEEEHDSGGGGGCLEDTEAL